MAKKREPVKDDRMVAGASATLSNVGPQRSGPIDHEDADAFAGTSSGARLRGKPSRGSRQELRY